VEADGRRDWWAQSDDELFAECEFDRYRASGPGGQKRNKTDSAVRLRHRPTGLIVTAADSRSQHLNRARALKRLRAALAYEVRRPPGDPPTGAAGAVQGGKLTLRPRDPRFPPTAAWVLDLLLVAGGRISDVAERLGISTGNLVKFLAADPDCWQAANRVRAQTGQKPLKSGV
jgi:hypothetical protein